MLRDRERKRGRGREEWILKNPLRKVIAKERKRVVDRHEYRAQEEAREKCRGTESQLKMSF